ncbi:phosphopantetheine-binding protein [Endomicrobium proavitum]|uniref:Acyl carrier protein n=1 Tax=Endomicrobium proavitum TaxID=1408281 RepID=A0A0G3WK88_9BACT|nr:phosphopantetheine-binding protein [Endomicrobium proavitum]AKL98315.1 acyl carrier protein [Endomicrobium proavitum]
MIPTSLDDIKKVLSANLDIEGIDLDSVNEDTPLFFGLGLDSLDAIELVIILRKNYDIVIENMDEGRNIFQTIGTLRKHIEANRKK